MGCLRFWLGAIHIVRTQFFGLFWPHLPPARKMTPLLLNRAIYCARIWGNPSPLVRAHYMDGPLPCFQYSFHYIYSFQPQRLLRQLFLFLKRAATFKESTVACSVSSTLLLPARNTSWRIDDFGQLLFLNLFCLVFGSYCCYCWSYCQHAPCIYLYHLKTLPPSLNTMLMYFNKSLLLSQGSKGGTCPPRLCSNSCSKWM